MDKKFVFNIPVSWESYGVVQIEASTLQEAIKIFDDTKDDIYLPDAECVDGSFHREEDEETIESMNINLFEI